MAIVLESNYAKEIGLPEYSSHENTVSLQSKLSDLSRVLGVSQRISHLLHDSDEDKFRETGFHPGVRSQRLTHKHPFLQTTSESTDPLQ